MEGVYLQSRNPHGAQGQGEGPSVKVGWLASNSTFSTNSLYHATAAYKLVLCTLAAGEKINLDKNNITHS